MATEVVEALMVIKFPDVPVQLRSVIVCVVPEVKVTVFGAPMVRVLKVLEP